MVPPARREEYERRVETCASKSHASQHEAVCGKHLFDREERLWQEEPHLNAQLEQLVEDEYYLNDDPDYQDVPVEPTDAASGDSTL